MAPKRHHPHPKWKQTAPIPNPPSRTKLTTKDIAELAKKMQHEFGWESEPRSFQLEGTKAQLEGTDMIIQAPTGCGKTAVAAGPHVWPSSKGKITIVISPLLALEEEMVHTFARDFKLSAIAVHNRNGGCSRATAQKLLSETYQILLVSPEMIQSRTFVNRVLRNPKFSRKVLSMVVDEAHCISHWGADFRKKYGTLGVVRTFLPRNTPVVAMTATLTARARRDIHTKLQFSKGHSRFINIGNDRPNVSMVVRSLEHTQTSYLDLDFVIPTTVGALTDIPKTWVYVDNIATGNEIVDHLEALLNSRVNSTERDIYGDAIRPFNAVLSLSYRRAAMEAFREGKIRVMVCTDAAGMGCDIPDVDVVVQWMMPKTFSNWIQRAGRAARGRGRTGLAVLLVPASVYKKVIDMSMNVSNQGSSGGTSKGKGSKKAKDAADTITPEEYAILHGVNRGKQDKQDQRPAAKQPPFDEDAADEGLTVFVQSTSCRREVWARAFDTQFDRTVLTVPCCDICDPALFDRARPGSRPKVPTKAAGKLVLRKRGQAVPEVEKRLREWRRMIYRRDHEFAVYEAKSILSDEMVSDLASHGDLTQQGFVRLLSTSWLWWERYGNELYDLMKSLATIPYIPIKAKAATSKQKTNATSAIDDLLGSNPPPSGQSRTHEVNTVYLPEVEAPKPVTQMTPAKRTQAGAEISPAAHMDAQACPGEASSSNKRPRKSQTSDSNNEIKFEFVTFNSQPPLPPQSPQSQEQIPLVSMAQATTPGSYLPPRQLPFQYSHLTAPLSTHLPSTTGPPLIPHPAQWHHEATVHPIAQFYHYPPPHVPAPPGHRHASTPNHAMHHHFQPQVPTQQWPGLGGAPHAHAPLSWPATPTPTPSHGQPTAREFALRPAFEMPLQSSSPQTSGHPERGPYTTTSQQQPGEETYHWHFNNHPGGQSRPPP